MERRQEVKYLISVSDAVAIRTNLHLLARSDPHANAEGWYSVHSVYFDDPMDTVLESSRAGLSTQRKFRLRYYRRDPSAMILEWKTKENGLYAKYRESITPQEALRIQTGDLEWMKAEGRPLLTRLYAGMRTELLRMKSYVEYERMPFIFEPGHVRVTMDRKIRTGGPQRFFTPGPLLAPAEDEILILEVKWAGVLPSLIRKAIAIPGRSPVAFSKYAVSRSLE